MFPFRFYQQVVPKELPGGDSSGRGGKAITGYHQDLLTLIESLEPSDRYYVSRIAKLVPFLPKKDKMVQSKVYLFHIDQKELISDLGQSDSLEDGDEIWIADHSEYYSDKQYHLKGFKKHVKFMYSFMIIVFTFPFDIYGFLFQRIV